ncbi:hypothetical protein R3W88_027785 [Solanum pinnatisectum]|uniref:DUF4378 domain-containing protein n=1 Tax=Solanum pinnatisectum TaxID=50273 RepID=A0AAV9LH00_9SOLN|nr:hypothetical protein R3W88_027785 [Solanum pinnatisectum]
MGKGLRSRRECNPPGCMFGILHHLNQQRRWHQVRKRLPYIKQAGGKHIVAAGDRGSNATATDSSNIPEKIDVKSDDSPIVVKAEAKTVATQHKSSLKSRLKTLITKELLSSKRVQHRRTLSCPIRMPLEQTAPICYLGPANVEYSLKICLNDEILQQPQNKYSSVASLLDPPLPEKRKDAVTNNKKCELCASMLDMNHFKLCDTNKNGKQPITNFSFRRTQSLYLREQTKNVSVQESKLFLDALDLLNMREELFLKILQDPNSSLARQLHGTRASKGLTKSVSFPSRLSHEKIAARSSNDKRSQDKSQIRGELLGSAGFESAEKLNRHLVTRNEEEVAKGVLTRLESFDKLPPSSPAALKHKRHNSKLVLARFRNLKEKITHALKESRKEKHRIVMDAVLHKVPHGRRSSKNVKLDGSDGSFSESTGNTSRCHSPFSKSPMKYFKRTSSLNDSLDSYSRLLETCFSRDEKQNSSERSSLRASRSPSPARSRPIVLERILSLPDLRHYPSFRIEDTPEASYSETLDTAASTASSSNLYLGATRSNEQKSLDIPLGSEKKTQQDSCSDSKIPENFLDVSKNSDDIGGLKTEESSFPVEYNMDDNSSTNSTLDEPISTTLPDMIIQEASTIPADLSATEGIEENVFDSNEEEILGDEQTTSLLQIQVDEKNKAEFNYVKDVLNLSGFSGNEFMNLSVFEELGGSFLSQPECSGYAEESENYDQLLLFDLINEVLLQLYEKSSLYWPKALTSRSYIHPMLHVGYYLLEEVWKDVSWWLSFKLENDQSLLDDAASRDLDKRDNWMNLQFDAECVGLELEELIFDDLLDELIFIDVY